MHCRRKCHRRSICFDNLRFMLSSRRQALQAAMLQVQPTEVSRVAVDIAAGKHRQAGKHRHQQANGRGFSSVCSCSSSMCGVLPCITTVLPCCRQGHGSEGEGGLGGLGGGSNREETGKMSAQRLFCVHHSSTDMWQLCRSRLLQAGIDKQQSSSNGRRRRQQA